MVINRTISAINLRAWQRLIYATDLIFFQKESQFLLGARSQISLIRHSTQNKYIKLGDDGYIS